MMRFGEDGDLVINLDGPSFAHIGGTYELPEGKSHRSPEADSYLGGALEFEIVEIEVYLLHST